MYAAFLVKRSHHFSSSSVRKSADREAHGMVADEIIEVTEGK
jgi:hypothetical protein